MSDNPRVKSDKIARKKSIRCKNCSSTNIVKYGTFEGMQRYFCKDCKRKFADNDALPKMKTPVWVIASVLDYYYDGMSLEAIQSQINRQYGAHYAQSSIYNWVIRFSKEAIEQTKFYQLKTGSIWLAHETVIKMGDHQFWFWDIFDIESRSLLASRLIKIRVNKEATGLVQTACMRAGTNPEQIITAMSPQYFDDARTNLNTGNGIIQHISSVKKYYEDIAQKFQRQLRKRDDIIRSFRNFDTARMLNDAWLVHYNFIKANNNTRRKARATKIGEALLNSWADIINQSKIKK